MSESMLIDRISSLSLYKSRSSLCLYRYRAHLLGVVFMSVPNNIFVVDAVSSL